MTRTPGFAALSLAAALLAAPAALAQTPIGSLSSGGITIEGTVTDVFGNRFVVQDSTGRVLVEAGPERHHRLDIRPGERLRITGRPDKGGFDAFTIRRENGTEIFIRPPYGPPPWSGGGRRSERDADGSPRVSGMITPEAVLRAVAAAGYRAERAPQLERRHYEVVAINPRGERVKLHVDFEGRIYRETWDRGRGFGGRPTETDARRAAEAAGYTLTGPLVPHPRHYEALAKAPDGREVRLHLHAEGIRRVEDLR